MHHTACPPGEGEKRKKKKKKKKKKEKSFRELDIRQHAACPS
jgi:hypothetical protein